MFTIIRVNGRGPLISSNNFSDLYSVILFYFHKNDKFLMTGLFHQYMYLFL